MSALRRATVASLLASALAGPIGCQRDTAPHGVLPAPSPPRELTPPGAGVERGAGANLIASAPRDPSAAVRPHLALAYAVRRDRLDLTARGVPLSEVLAGLARATDVEFEGLGHLGSDEPVDARLEGVALATGVERLLWAYDKTFAWASAPEVDAPPRLARVLVLAPSPHPRSPSAERGSGVELADALLEAVESGDDAATAALAGELASAERGAGRTRAAAALARTLLSNGAGSAPTAVRARAARALGWLEDPESQAALRHAFLTGEREVRSAAAAALRRQAARSPSP